MNRLFPLLLPYLLLHCTAPKETTSPTLTAKGYLYNLYEQYGG